MNQSILWIPVTHSWFTLDPDDRVWPILTRPREGVTYYLAVPDDYGQARARVWYHRRRPPEGAVYLHRRAGPGVFRSREQLAEDKSEIHTGNSAWGALGLAYHFEPERIAILGLDGDGARYAYGKKKPRLPFHHLPNLFASALPQLEARGVEVINGSPESRITCFERRPAIDALAWIVS